MRGCVRRVAGSEERRAKAQVQGGPRLQGPVCVLGYIMGSVFERQSPLRGVGTRTLLSELREEGKAEAEWVGWAGSAQAGAAFPLQPQPSVDAHGTLPASRENRRLLPAGRIQCRLQSSIN